MRTGLVLVDIQNDYFPEGRMELVGMDKASSKAKQLLALFRQNQWPVFHIQHIAHSDNAPFFLPDTKGVEIHVRVEPLSKEPVIQKHYPNSFRETRLFEELKNAAVEKVVICGAMSHMCIDATTRAAADLGFGCTVVHDACATKNLEFAGKTIAAEEVHGSFMAALGFAYAQVLSLDEYMESIRRTVTK
jgi:nicotinamidase-related amidase